MQTILAVDDERSVRESYRLILSEDYHVVLAENGKQALKVVEDQHVDLVLLDLMMPGLSGLELLDQLLARNEFLPVIIISGMKSVSTAVEAMKRGAKEYVIKPFDVDEITLMVERTLAEEKKNRELTLLREASAKGFEAIIGESPALKKVVGLAQRAGAVDSTVLITGESGTGKDMLARAIHKGGSRKDEAYVPVSCCAIPEQLVESELFGHEKGSFTGATEKRIGKVQVADKGTLFLDEIGEMPLEAQAKLLRLLQENQIAPVGSTKIIEVDVRFVCATNRNLQKEVREGRFREDLYYRMNVLPIEMPPLRQRREDIPLLVSHFVAKHAPRVNAKAAGFDSGALAALAAYEWPGNVRELENVVERLLVHHGDEEAIRQEHLDGALMADHHGASKPTDSLVEFDGLPLEEAIGRLEHRLISRALERSANVQSKAAELLGTTRRILKYKMDQLGIAD